MDSVPDSIPQPPEGAPFRLVGIHHDFVTGTHPFMIGPKHITDFGRIDYTVGCYWPDRRGQPRCNKPHSDPVHKSLKALYIAVNDNEDLNHVSGLKDYLLSIKEAATAAGIDGFAFPNEQQAATL